MGLTSSSEQAEDRSEVSVQFADDSPAVETQQSHDSESASTKLVKALRNEGHSKKITSQEAAHDKLEALREELHKNSPRYRKSIQQSQSSSVDAQKEAIVLQEELQKSADHHPVAQTSRNGIPVATSSKVDSLTIGTDCSGMEAPLMALENIGVQWKSKLRCDNDA